MYQFPHARLINAQPRHEQEHVLAHATHRAYRLRPGAPGSAPRPLVHVAISHSGVWTGGVHARHTTQVTWRRPLRVYVFSRDPRHKRDTPRAMGLRCTSLRCTSLDGIPARPTPRPCSLRARPQSAASGVQRYSTRSAHIRVCVLCTLAPRTALTIARAVLT